MLGYSEEAIDKLCEAVVDEKGVEAWFTENGSPELWHFWNALDNDEKSFRWLMANRHPELAAIVDTISGNDQAKKWLIMNGFRELAAFADATEGSQSAVTFLLQAKEEGLVRFAQALYKANKKSSKNFLKSLLNFGNPYGR